MAVDVWLTGRNSRDIFTGARFGIFPFAVCVDLSAFRDRRFLSGLWFQAVGTLLSSSSQTYTLVPGVYERYTLCCTLVCNSHSRTYVWNSTGRKCVCYYFTLSSEHANIYNTNV